MNKKRKVNVMLYGEGSFLNKGCEAIVNTTIKKIQKSCEGEIILSTNDFNYDSKYYNNIITQYVNGYYKENELTAEEKKMIEYYKTIPFDYTNFEKMYTKDCLKKIDEVDICISVGGDNYCYGEPNWIYTINKTVKEKNRKNVFWCTSLFEKIESDEMIRDLKTYDVIIARETLTYKALEKFIEKDRLMISPDTAFSLRKKETKLPEVFENGKNVVGINISPLISKYTDSENNILNSIKALIDYILNTTDNNICLIPHVYIENNNDLESLKIIKEMYKNENRVELLGDRIYDCEELKYIISNCKYLVAARTHASIAAYSTLVPTLVIGYSVKSKGIALDLFGEYENYVIPVNELTPDTILEKYEYIQKNTEKIKKILAEKMKLYKEKADSQFEELLNRLDYLDKVNITNKCKCTGCMACFNTCPNDAIIKEVDKENGFIYPIVDEEKCTHCNLCKKVCPANKNYTNEYKNKEFYAAINKNEDERMKSSSGGIISCISKKVLQNSGIVYGAAFVEKKVSHIRIDDIENLDKILGSKYVQSDVDKKYMQVKKDLDNNKNVLFTGTPCQIEGLKSYLNEEYENLLCVSIICHGVPSPEIFDRYMNEKEEINTKIKNVEFRNKENGWHDYCVKYNYNDNSEIIKFNRENYMKGFLNNYFLRESCYNCQMRLNKKNTADIIIGDFWGVENIFPDMDDNKGTSAVIINSEKGSKIFKEIIENIEYRRTTYEDILKSNPVLESSVKYTKNREEFFKLIRNNSINDAIAILENPKLERKLSNLEEEIDILNGQIKDLLDAKKYFLGQIELRDIQLNEKKNEIEKKSEQIQKICQSKRWMYTNKIANTINKIIGKK